MTLSYCLKSELLVRLHMLTIYLSHALSIYVLCSSQSKLLLVSWQYVISCLGSRHWSYFLSPKYSDTECPSPFPQVHTSQLVILQIRFWLKWHFLQEAFPDSGWVRCAYYTFYYTSPNIYLLYCNSLTLFYSFLSSRRENCFFIVVKLAPDSSRQRVGILWIWIKINPCFYSLRELLSLIPNREFLLSSHSVIPQTWIIK